MAEKEKNPTEGKRRRWPKILAWIIVGTLAVTLAIIAALIALAPTILTSIDYPEYVYDLTESLPEDARGLFTNRTARIKVRLMKHHAWDLVAIGEGAILDWPVSFDARLNYSVFGLSVDGAAHLRIDKTDMRADATFAASAKDGWAVDVSIPETEFCNDDAFLGDAARRFVSLSPSVSNLVFSGKMKFSASAATTNGIPVPTWNADAWVQGLDVALLSGETPISMKPISMDGFRMHAGASGIGTHVDIKPTFPRATCIEAAGFAMSNVFASVRATETAYLVTEAGADVCGGKARIYSLFLMPERLDAGFTLFLDDIDAGLALESIAEFNGTATGRLRGKIPMRLKGGSELVFGDAYLHSIPGETGTIRIADADPRMRILTLSGLPEDERANIAKAMRNLTYKVLNINLRKESEDEHALSYKLEGSATSGETTVPVSFEITLRGPMQTVINTGIRAARRR